MKYFFLFLFLPSLAFGASQPPYEIPDAVINENFKAIYNDYQSKNFTLATTTPLPSDIGEGQIILFSSGAIKIMTRIKNDIYSIQMSCITVVR